MIDHRLQREEYFMGVTQLVAMRSTCRRRRVGCVLVDEHNHIVGTGYNGAPRGHPHCYLTPCKGAGLQSGTGLDVCEAVHAEQNALMQCPNINAIRRVYCTTAPCMTCAKMLLNTPVHTIYFLQNYVHQESEDLLLANGRSLIRVDMPFNINLHGWLERKSSYVVED